jgi:hypothetical protein
VSIGTATNSPDPGEPGALKGTATSWSIPAGTLQPNTTYDASITFLRANSATNAAQLYVTLAARGAYTTFPLTTGSGTGPTGPIELGAASVLPGSKVAFSVTAPAHQSLIIESKDALAPGNWTPLLTTDNPTGTVRYTNTIPNGVNTRFYRARSGP